jgi:hypothetical protein
MEDPVSRINNYCQQHHLPLPIYNVQLHMTQGQTQPRYRATVQYDNCQYYSAACGTKKAAKADAAQQLCAVLFVTQKLSVLTFSHEAALLIDTVNFPNFIAQLFLELEKTRHLRFDIFMFVAQGRMQESTDTKQGVVVVPASSQDSRAVHTKMTAYLGLMLSQAHYKEYVFVVGDKLAQGLIALAQTPTGAWQQAQASQCKNAYQLLCK